MSGEPDEVTDLDLYDSSLEPARPPVAAIPSELEATEHALMTDAARLEDLALICLQDLDPSLRPTSGPGDRQRRRCRRTLFETRRWR